MAMAVDTRQQPQLGGLGYDHLRYPGPQFTNPWVSATTSTPSSHLYSTSLAPPSVSLDSAQQISRPTTLSMPYSSLPVTAPSLGTGNAMSGALYEPQNLLGASQDLLNSSRAYGAQYAVSTSPTTSTYAPTSAPQYAVDYTSSRSSPYTYSQDTSRRSSHPSVPSVASFDSPVETQKPRPTSLVDFSRMTTQAQRNSFSDALDASRGMVAMSQDITPRNIYGGQAPGRPTDSYGFPSTHSPHSPHSSISSASTYPSYYNGSATDSSVTDYSSASESVDMNPRTLPRPSALMGGALPPAPQSMMGQFSSKVSSSSQKKHKCKVCDKRFTRPSSLQTHMYSHTGEKPYACEVEGCGRHFSVVSNLRRHRKVHKRDDDHSSPDDM